MRRKSEGCEMIGVSGSMGSYIYTARLCGDGRSWSGDDGDRQHGCNTYGDVDGAAGWSDCLSLE